MKTNARSIDIIGKLIRPKAKENYMNWQKKRYYKEEILK